MRFDVDRNQLVACLRNDRLWLNWKPQIDEKGKIKKVPINNAKTTDPDSWNDFDTVYSKTMDDSEIGIGITLYGGLTGIDMDHVRDAETGQIAEDAQKVIDLMDSYTEISPSGTGIHILCLGLKPEGTCKRNFPSGTEFEIYDQKRYFTFTGNAIRNIQPQDRQAQINEFYAKWMTIPPVEVVPMQQFERRNNTEISQNTPNIDTLNDEIIQTIRESWRDIIVTMTEPAKRQVNHEMSYVCPICGHGKGGDGLTLNPKGKSGSLKCFGCGFSGDIIDLYMRVNEKEFVQSVKELAEIIGIAIDDYPVKKSQNQDEQQNYNIRQIDNQTPVKTGNYDGKSDYTSYYQYCAEYLNDLQAVSYLSDRGISLEIAYQYKLGFDEFADPATAPGVIEGMLNRYPTPRIIIPISKSYYIGRAVSADVKYRYANPKKETASIFNLQTVWDSDPVFITEGAFDALSILMAGGQAIALNSTSNDKILLAEFDQKKPKSTLILSLDNDKEGRDCTNRLEAELKSRKIPYIIANISGTCKDPNEALIADKKRFFTSVKNAKMEAEVIKATTTITGGTAEMTTSDDDFESLYELLHPETNTDAGQADVFCKLHAEDTRYYTKNGKYKWYSWNGQLWEEGANQAVKAKIERMARKQFQIANRLSGIAGGKNKILEEMRNFAFKCQNNNRLNTIFRQIGIQDDLRISDINLMDGDPFALNTPSGIVDLRTGEIKPHDPKAYSTRITGCGMGATDDQRKIWNDFLLQIMEGDLEMLEYLQEIAGMFAIGKVYEEKLVIAIGNGGNGKSTFFNALLQTLGTYAGSVSSDLVATPKNFFKSLDNEKGFLRGLRLGVAGELEEGTVMNTKRIKDICSTDDLTVTEKFLPTMTFTPTHSIVLHTNHLPEVKSTDNGTWDRLILIPFEARFRGEGTEIKNYAEKLFQEAGEAILEWIVAGSVMFIKNNCKLHTPDTIQKMIFDYRQSNLRNNPLTEWIETRCITGSNQQENASSLFKDYQQWQAEDPARITLNQTTFGIKLTEMGFEKKRTMSGNIRKGIALLR